MLNRPTHELNRNPLRPDELPPSEGMSLRYRVSTGWWSERYWFFFFLSCSLFSVPVVLGAQIAASYLHSTFALALGSLLLTAGALHDLTERPWYYEFNPVGWTGKTVMLFSAVGLWFAFRLFSDASAMPATQLVLFAAAIATNAFLADRIATHYVAWAAADPRVSDQTRERIETAWRRRFHEPGLLCSPSLKNTPLAALGDYQAGIALLLLAFLLAVAILVPYGGSPFFGLLVVCLTLVLFTAVAALWVAFGHPRPWRACSRCLRAIASWASYDAYDSAAAGVFKSPVGRCAHNRKLASACVALLSLSILPFAAYFPIVPLLDNYEAWLSASQQRLFSDKKQADPPPDFSAVSPTEERYLHTLPPLKQRTYLENLESQKKVAYQAAKTESHYRQFAYSPHAWLLAALRGATHAETRFAAGLLVGLLASVFAPAALFFAIFLLIAGRITMLIDTYLQPDIERFNRDSLSSTDEPRSDWDAYVERLQSSTYVTTSNGKPVYERDHLWLGVNAEYGYPILLDRHILHEHGHILGDSGSGKTALALAPMIAQLTRLSGRLKNDQKCPIDQQISLVIIDLKGDRSLFHGAKIEAKRAGLPFKWFTNVREHATYSFNPFTQPHIKDLTVSQRTEVLIQALGLQYGEFYGAGYFSSVNQTVLRRYLKAYQAEVHSFDDLNQKTQSPALYQATFEDTGIRKARKDDWREAGHLLTRIDALAAVSAINVSPTTVHRGYVPPVVLDDQIDMGDVLRRPQVVYFYLSSITETVAVQGIAKLALYALLTAADRFEPGTFCRAYVFIDEFQQIVANNLELVLRQARSKNMACILANQNLTDLQTPGSNLMHTVEANTAFKQMFRASSEFQRDHLVRSSGETIYHMVGHSESQDSSGRSSVSESVSEQLGPRFRINDVIQTSYADTESLVHISKGSGFTRYGGQMFALRSSFHIGQEEYTRRNHAPWPEAGAIPGTFVAAELDATSARAEANRDPAPQPEAAGVAAPPAGPAESPAPADRTLFDAIEAFKKGTAK